MILILFVNNSITIAQENENILNERFRKAYALIQKEEYKNALSFLELNILEFPITEKIDYSYAWASLCYAYLCQSEESLKYYRIIKSNYSGDVKTSGITRNWSDKLKKIEELLIGCDFRNKSEIAKKIKMYKINADSILFPAYDGNNPCIIKTDSIYKLIIPPKMKEALVNFDKRFTPWTLNNFSSIDLKIYKITKNQLPYAVIGDFNGDRKLDLFLFGHNNSAIISLCIQSNSNHFYVQIIDKKPNTEKIIENHFFHINYGYVKKKEISSHYEEEILNLDSDAIWGSFPEKASWILYHKDGEFHQFKTAD